MNRYEKHSNIELLDKLIYWIGRESQQQGAYLTTITQVRTELLWRLQKGITAETEILEQKIADLKIKLIAKTKETQRFREAFAASNYINHKEDLHDGEYHRCEIPVCLGARHLLLAMPEESDVQT